MFDVARRTVIFLVHAKPLKKLVVWLNVAVFFVVVVATIPHVFPLSRCISQFLTSKCLKKWNHSTQFNVCCVSTAIPKDLTWIWWLRIFGSIQKRVLATFFGSVCFLFLSLSLSYSLRLASACNLPNLLSYNH